MDWPWKYMIRVTGLGEVEALFLVNAHNDDEARRDCRSSDPRVTVIGLYRIRCLIDQVEDPEVQKLNVETAKSGSALYLLTGVPGKPNGTLENLFFECETA